MAISYCTIIREEELRGDSIQSVKLYNYSIATDAHNRIAGDDVDDRRLRPISGTLVSGSEIGVFTRRHVTIT